MNRAESIMIVGQNYYQMNKKRIWTLGLILLMLIILFSVGFITKTVTAQRNTERIKLVTNIEVEKGDTLWSLASRFMSEEYDDVNEYIEEIKDSNDMYSDEIHVGTYLIIPYYADASN